MGLEFKTAALAVTDDGQKGNPLVLDGVTLYYRTPSEGQLTLAMALTGSRQEQHDQLSGLIDFFSVFDKKSQAHLQKRLLDTDDPFSLTAEGGINDILDALFEEWSGRPTRRSTGSTDTQSTTGPSSKPPTPESISSESDLTASSTSSTPG